MPNRRGHRETRGRSRSSGRPGYRKGLDDGATGEHQQHEDQQGDVELERGEQFDPAAHPVLRESRRLSGYFQVRMKSRVKRVLTASWRKPMALGLQGEGRMQCAAEHLQPLDEVGEEQPERDHMGGAERGNKAQVQGGESKSRSGHGNKLPPGEVLCRRPLIQAQVDIEDRSRRLDPGQNPEEPAARVGPTHTDPVGPGGGRAPAPRYPGTRSPVDRALAVG